MEIKTRGVLVNTLYGVKENINRTSFLEFINALNTEFMFMKAYINDQGLMRIETFFEGDYDRTNFSILLDNIDSDIDTLFGHDLTEAYLR